MRMMASRNVAGRILQILHHRSEATNRMRIVGTANVGKVIVGRVIVAAVAGLIVLTLLPRARGQDALPMPERVSFTEHIRPILSKACYACHGPDAGQVKGGLQLHRESAAKSPLGPGGGRAIVPGHPEESTLIERINARDDLDRMPPAGSGKKLSDRQKKLLSRWIEQGATWERHWSLSPPRRSAPPDVRDESRIRNDYDRFVQRRLEDLGVAPAPPADPAHWLRRVTLDLTGLPPTIEELDAFLDDKTPGARSRVVDRLLASEASAERLTLEWLDCARFADSNGYQYDGPNNQWPWRDWVIDAFKKNMPFDEFVTQQLSGDLLPDATLDQRIATAFNRNHGFTIEGGVTPEEYRVQYVNDRVVTFGTVFLGMTLECARCHDHKFDDISMRDFYSLSSFFDNIPGSGYWGGGLNTVATPVENYSTTDPERLATLKADLDRVTARVDELVASDVPEYVSWKQEVFDTERATRIVAMSASKDGVVFEEQKDRSWQVGGKVKPDRLSISIELETDAVDLRSVILEPVVDRGKLGRSRKGTAVLSHIDARVRSTVDPKLGRELVFDSAVGKNHREKEGVELALGKSPGGWWLPRRPSREDRIAVFSSPAPFGYEGGSRITVTLHFESGRQSFARVRVRLSASRAAGRRACDFAFDPDVGDPKRHFVERHYRDFRQRRGDARRKYEAEKNRSVPVMVMVEQKKKRQTRILLRGQYDAPSDDVSPDVPGLIGGWRDGYPRNRLGLARWLTSSENPLFARVTVNRYWQMLFGTGLVRTAEDFGAQGEPPTHPQLLDQLALDFIESGWDLRSTLKKIVLSATYCQSSAEREDTEDPRNRLLARGPRFRLAAETIRDQALFVSGLLVRKKGGPSVMVYQPEGLWLDLGDRRGFTRAHVVGSHEDVHRRSMYIYAKRAMPNPVLSTFDTPTRDVCVLNRQVTNTPLQALVLRHEKGYVEAARSFAERLMKREGTLEARLGRAWRMLLARRPEATEIAAMAKLHADRLEFYREHPKVRSNLLGLGKEPRDEALDGVEVAALTEVCRVLFNLGETVTRE
ncbi:MAG: hypothetical protein CMJ83_17300 [Planctomycetes bacterium]|nr:hypothetical protein [Planctomycetota bacterium]